MSPQHHGSDVCDKVDKEGRKGLRSLKTQKKKKKKQGIGEQEYSFPGLVSTSAAGQLK